MKREKRNLPISGISIVLLAASGALFLFGVAVTFVSGGVGLGTKSPGMDENDSGYLPENQIDQNDPLFIG